MADEVVYRHRLFREAVDALAGALGIGGVHRLGCCRRIAKGKGADAARRALDGMGDLLPALGIAGHHDAAKLADHFADLAV